jgi:hypothetical protein
MVDRTVVVFGAGATKACGGPLTNEILPRAFERRGEIERENFLATVENFLVENFSLPSLTEDRTPEHYPPLPLVLSLLDMAIDRKQSFGANWSTARLEDVQSGLEYLIFAVLTYELEAGPQGSEVDHYQRIFEKFLDSRKGSGEYLTVISLNYDIIADSALMRVSEAFPKYECDIATQRYREGNQRIKLLKLHGSLNWMYCPACQRLDLGVTRRGGSTIKVLADLYQEQANSTESLEHRYSCKGSPCADRKCGTPVRPVLLAPTHMKDYRNPHIARIWYEAALALRSAQRVHVIGYSMPPDDVEVAYLLKRNLGHLPAQKITVVEFDAENSPLGSHEVGRRFRALFGERTDWFTGGFQAYEP